MLVQMWASNALTVVTGSLYAVQTLVDLVDEESLGAKCTDRGDTVDLFRVHLAKAQQTNKITITHELRERRDDGGTSVGLDATHIA